MSTSPPLPRGPGHPPLRPPAPPRPALPSNRVLLSASGTVLFAFILHRLSVLQTLLFLPLLLITAIAIAALSLLASVVRSGRVPGSLEPQRRRHALRQMKFATPSAWSAVLTKREWEERTNPAEIVTAPGAGESSSLSTASTYPLRPRFPPVHKHAGPRVNKRLDTLLSLIRTSFVLPWYTRLSPSPAFPDAVEGIIRHALGEIARHAEVVDWSNVVVSRILPIVTDHLQHYRSVEHLAGATGAPNSSSSGSPSALPLPLPTKVHDALSSQVHLGLEASVASIEAHFRVVLGPALTQLIPEKERTAVVTTLVREIVIGTIMVPVFQMLCDSDFWNKQIDDKGGKYLHEQKQVDQFLSALSSLPNPTSSPTSSKKPSSSPLRRTTASTSISSHSSTKQFDDFMRSIPKLKTLGEARRLRADVDRELRAARAAHTAVLAANHEGKDGERRLKRAERYVHRLEKARAQIDGRIGVLSGQPTIPPSLMSPPPAGVSASADINLYAILSDPSSLAYWLEYMERRGRSRLLQFWLTVEGFKDPLESVGQHSALESLLDSSLPQAVIGATLEEDITFLYQAYFAPSTGPSAMAVPTRYAEVITEFATRPVPKEVEAGLGPRLSPTDARRAKHAMYAAQKAVYEQMEDEDWKTFHASELFLKAVAELKKVTPPALPHPSRAKSLSPQLGPAVMLSPPPAPVSHPSRQLTAPLPTIHRLPDVQHPPAQHPPASRRPHLVNGTFTPVSSVAPSASITTSAPHFDAPARGSRQVTPNETSRATSMSPSLSIPATPPPMQRGMSHLDFLISGGEGAKTEERSKLFEDDDDDGLGLHGDDDDDDDYVQVQRIEAIQAALNEIIASDDMVSSRVLDSKLSNEIDPLRSPSASMILPTRPMELGASKLKTSRSVEDLGTVRGKTTPSAPRVASAGVTTTGTTATPHTTALARRSSMSKLLLGSDKPKHIFDDESADEDEVEDTQDIAADDAQDVVQLAAPGDLQLSVEIARLQDKIQDLVKHEALLDSLIRQAELTGNQKELRLLQRSLSSIRREQRTAIFQKAQFEQQEEENRLVPGRTRVSIPSSVVAEDGEGKGVVRYTIEVSQMEDDGRIGISWVVARRYNEFWELDRAIKDWAMTGDQAVQEEVKRVVEIPGKRLVSNMSASFVESRRTGLERYLQSLVACSRICEGPHLRAFLSQSSVRVGTTSSDSSIGANTTAFSSLAPHNLVKSIYKTMASSLDDALLGPSMLDLMSHTLGRQLVDVAEGIGGLVGVGEDLAGLVPSALKGSHWVRPGSAGPGSGPGSGLPGSGSTSSAQRTPGAGNLPAAMQPIGGETAVGAFTVPICDFFIELFDLKENNWLRRQAIVIILQQILGSTIERKVRDSLKSLTSDESIERTLAGFQETLWPGGERRPPSVPRTEEEKSETRLRASRKMALLIPDVAANMIGRGNARRAARRVFGALQDKRLNQHLMLCILDELFGALFPHPKQD